MRPARLLLIEDDADVLLINREYFSGQGYEVLSATTLEEARTILAEGHPDLILLDVMLPDGNGFDFCRELRMLTAAPIIYLTCLGQEGEIIQGLRLGGDDYVVKPYDIDVLGARVMAQLRRAGMFNSGRVELPPLTVDLLTGSATLNGQQVQLSQKELQLLAFMAASAGQSFSSEQLYEQVWGAPALEASQTVKVHISYLRKKLHMDEEDSPFEIRLTKDKGYCFNKIRYD